MKITESELRRVIKNVIIESEERMYDEEMASPEEMGVSEEDMHTSDDEKQELLNRLMDMYGIDPDDPNAMIKLTRMQLLDAGINPRTLEDNLEKMEFDG
tara:strand:+ start:1088 stop:1384 length:297 start_codon:yes stop_codon:yes gene_type:complete